jgi:hypothetical protein
VPATRPVLRIFVSSTAIDLTGYRDKVRDAVLRLENLPIAMETFSALAVHPRWNVFEWQPKRMRSFAS